MLRYDRAVVELDIEVTFDMRSDTPPGRDPDRASPTLRQYHQILWSKPLPNGSEFALVPTRPGTYLHHRSSVGEFFLSSDTIIRTYRNTRRAAQVIQQIPEADREAFSRKGYTIGGMMLFPGNRIDGKQTINQRRGTHPKIEDRFDLTLECIRRYYLGETSPLSTTLELYRSFFDLFQDFRGYVQFFLLDDLVSPDFGMVRFFTPFDDFTAKPIPASVRAYEGFRARTLQFLDARNTRIGNYCRRHALSDAAGVGSLQRRTESVASFP